MDRCPSVHIANVVVAGRYHERRAGVINDSNTQLCWLRDPLRPSMHDSAQRGLWQWLWRWLRKIAKPGEAQKFGMGQASLYSWAEAMQAADEFNRAGGQSGYRDWRLPNRGELKTLLNRPQHPAAFPETITGRFWTSWPHRNPRYAWYVDFDMVQTGYLSKQARLQVRLVRGWSSQR